MGVAAVVREGEESEALPVQLQVERTCDGSVWLAAAPQATAAVVSLFSGIAGLISATNISGLGGGIDEMQ